MILVFLCAVGFLVGKREAPVPALQVLWVLRGVGSPGSWQGAPPEWVLPCLCVTTAVLPNEAVIPRAHLSGVAVVGSLQERPGSPRTLEGEGGQCSLPMHTPTP